MALDAKRLSKSIQSKVEILTGTTVTDTSLLDALCAAIVEEIQSNLEAVEVDLNLGGDPGTILYVDPAPVAPPSQDGNTAVPVNTAKQIVKGRTTAGRVRPGKIR